MSATCPKCRQSTSDWRGREGDGKKSVDNWSCPRGHAFSTPAR